MCDGQLSDNEREELMRHIENCPACELAYSAFSAMSEELHELSAVPENLCASVMQKVEPKKKRVSRRIYRFAGLAACFALVSVFALKSVSGAHENVATTSAETGTGAVMERSITSEFTAEESFDDTAMMSAVAHVFISADSAISQLIEVQEETEMCFGELVGIIELEDGTVVEVIDCGGEIICLSNGEYYTPTGSHSEITALFE